MRERRSLHRPLRSRQAAATAAAAVLVVGFGMMAALSATGCWKVGRDMWHYRAATWGDALLVPGICAAIAAGLADARIAHRAGERRRGFAGGAAFALAGILVQVSWLASARPILNWTLPAPHRFSFPGWYHAGFLVLLSGVIGAAGLVLALRVRSAPVETRDVLARTPAAAALVGFGLAFGIALAFDSTDSIATSAGMGSVLGASAAALTAIGLAALVFGVRRSATPVLRGLGVAALVTAGMLLTNGLPR